MAHPVLKERGRSSTTRWDLDDPVGSGFPQYNNFSSNRRFVVHAKTVQGFYFHTFALAIKLVGVFGVTFVFAKRQGHNIVHTSLATSAQPAHANVVIRPPVGYTTVS